MNKTYCPECGTKMEYVAKAPNFCTNCGFALSKAAQSRNVGPAGDIGVVGEESANEGLDYEVHNEYGDMETLDIEILGTNQNKGVSIGDLMGSAPEGSYQHNPSTQGKRRGRPKSKKKVLEELKSEAGSIKENRKES